MTFSRFVDPGPGLKTDFSSVFQYRSRSKDQNRNEKLIIFSVLMYGHMELLFKLI